MPEALKQGALKQDPGPHDGNSGTSSSHRFVVSSKLRATLERRRFAGRWSSVKGIAEANDLLVHPSGPFPIPVTEAIRAAAVRECREDGSAARRAARPLFDVTEVCVANCDTASAAIALGTERTCALNFANAVTAGGRYRSGGMAQEEDLCRLIPQLYPSLAAAARAGQYPIQPGTALLTSGVRIARHPGSYKRCKAATMPAATAAGSGPSDQCSSGGLCEVAIITAAMPCGEADRRPKGGWANSPWADSVKLRIRSVFAAAATSGRPNLVLGAFGCGAFGNPPGPVGAIFRDVLASSEFRGCFAKVVFAVIDPLGTGNLKPLAAGLALPDLARLAAPSPSFSSAAPGVPVPAQALEGGGAAEGRGGIQMSSIRRASASLPAPHIPQSGSAI